MSEHADSLQQAIIGKYPDVLAARLEAIGFRVLRRQTIDELLQYFDTQGGAVLRRGGRLCRELPSAGLPWRFRGSRQVSIRRESLAGIRRVVPWLPDAAELHPILLALRSGARLRVRGLATRDLTVVVERWSFAGTAPPAGGHDRGPLDHAACSVLHNGGADTAASVGQTPPFWYVAADNGPRHDRAYLDMVLAEHGDALGLRRGRPDSGWDPLTGGLALIGRLPPGLAAPRGLVVRRGDSLPAVLRKTIRLQGMRLASCVDGIVGDRHPEYVHDARVAVRRARFALLVAAANGDPSARELSDCLRSVARVLGPVRDLDVLLARLGELAAAARQAAESDAAAGGAAERRLADGLWGRREERRAAAAELLRRPETGRLVQQVSRWCAGGVADQPAAGSTRTALTAALEQVDKVGAIVLGSKPVQVPTLHRLRLRLKRLRYTAELFSGALPRRHENRSLDAVTAECSSTQTELGDLNDDAVAAVEIGATASMLSRHGHSPADLAEGMIGALHDRQEHAADTFVDGWRENRDRLRRALKELLG
ncbi:MAG: CHAD domain-containing protein [Spirochaetaceae bacterium]|nr:CHAD domain-containing protein [Spirochaetaceae bacterium]